MTNDPQHSESRVKRAWTVILAWIGGISAVLGFIGVVTGFFGNIQGHFHHSAQLDSEMAIAQTQSRQGDYRASVQSYADILKTEPLYRPVLDQQLQVTMLWVEDYHVYANAMLGNWMTLNGGSLTEAIQHFNSAVATGKARAFVRTLQLAGLEDRDEPGARAALMKAVNEMRKDGEPLDAEDKHRALGFCCDPSVTDHAELTESLSAVPADDAWQTYLWLDDQQNTAEDLKHRDIVHDFIAANISEISGDKQK